MNDVNEKILGRVQALLAKAESTEFPEEAEALFAKAQELITRHSIDEVLARTRSSSDKPELRRLQMEAPYASAKFTLISAVGRANDITVVGNQNYLVTMIGFRTDLDAVEMLFASLVIQATGAMFAAGYSLAGSRVPRFGTRSWSHSRTTSSSGCGSRGCVLSQRSPTKPAWRWFRCSTPSADAIEQAPRP